MNVQCLLHSPIDDHFARVSYEKQNIFVCSAFIQREDSQIQETGISVLFRIYLRLQKLYL